MQCFWRIMQRLGVVGSVSVALISCTLFQGNHERDQKYSGSMAELMTWLSKQPREDIRQDPASARYLADHKVFIALTSSPLRVKHLTYTLRTLDLTHVEAIILSLPERFERDDSSYDIPEEVTSFPKVVVQRTLADYGPLTKLVGAQAYIKQHYGSTAPASMGGFIIITIDDDTGYPAGMVNELVKQVAARDNTVFGASMPSLSYWGLPSPASAWPAGSGEELIEGFAGVAYKMRYIDAQAAVAIGAKQLQETGHRSCFYSDDLVVSFLLAQAGIARRRVVSRAYQRSSVIPYPFSFDDDGLGRLQEDGKAADPRRGHAVKERYAKCFAYMTKRFAAGS